MLLLQNQVYIIRKERKRAMEAKIIQTDVRKNPEWPCSQRLEANQRPICSSWQVFFQIKGNSVFILHIIKWPRNSPNSNPKVHSTPGLMMIQTSLVYESFSFRHKQQCDKQIIENVCAQWEIHIHNGTHITDISLYIAYCNFWNAPFFTNDHLHSGSLLTIV